MPTEKRGDGASLEHGANLVVLKEDQAEVELAEGQLEVLDVAVLDTLLVRQVEHGLASPPQTRCTAFPLGVQRRLKLILKCGEPPLGLRQLLCGGEPAECSWTSLTNHCSVYC